MAPGRPGPGRDGIRGVDRGGGCGDSGGALDRALIEPRPGWLDSLKGRSRLVYATLGTVFGDSPDIWAAIFAAVAAEPELHLVATLGPAVNPQRFGAVPANITVERYVPQSWVLDAADAVIAHGGYGTLMGALRRGLPIVTIPMPAADSLLNAARVTALGAGLMLGTGQRNAAAIRQALAAEEPPAATTETKVVFAGRARRGS